MAESRYYQVDPNMLPNDVAAEAGALLAKGLHFPVATLLFRVTDPRPDMLLVLDGGDLLVAPLVSCFNCGETDPTTLATGRCTPPLDRPL
jgi:hypothetical protein